MLYAHNQIRYKDVNVSSVLEKFIIEPGYEYTIKLATYTSEANDDKTDSTESSEQDDQIPFTNILMILLIAALVIYSFFKTVRKER